MSSDEYAIEENVAAETESRSFSRLPKRRNGLPVSAEFRFPLVLIGVAFLIWLGVGLYFAGIGEPIVGIIASIVLVFQGVVASIVSIAACFLVAALFGTAFGELKLAIVKLAAATMFPLAVGLLFLVYWPLLGCIAVFALSLSLLKTFFDLDLFELIAMVLAEALIAGVTGYLLGLL